MEIYASAALFGAVSGALVGASTGRAVNKAIDVAVKSVTTAYNGLTNFDDYRSAFPEIFLELESLDVDARLRMVLALLKNAEERSRTDSPGEETIDICLGEIRTSVDSITHDLEAVHRELRAHQERWFASFRSPHVSSLLKSLRVKMGVLDRRVDMLIKAQAFLEQSKAMHVLATSSSASGMGGATSMAFGGGAGSLGSRSPANSLYAVDDSGEAAQYQPLFPHKPSSSSPRPRPEQGVLGGSSTSEALGTSSAVSYE